MLFHPSHCTGGTLSAFLALACSASASLEGASGFLDLGGGASAASPKNACEHLVCEEDEGCRARSPLRREAPQAPFAGRG